jgi:hypothetical protein
MQYDKPNKQGLDKGLDETHMNRRVNDNAQTEQLCAIWHSRHRSSRQRTTVMSSMQKRSGYELPQACVGVCYEEVKSVSQNL